MVIIDGLIYSIVNSAIFGMDVGGTLTKIVYFQADATEAKPPMARHKSSENLAHLESPDHQAALEQLYTHLDPHTGALSSREVVRDTPLTVFSNFLHGSLHFMHFETRNLVDAIDFLSSTAVTDHIKSIGCTGGGAHKYDKTIMNELDITVNQFDELGCLVRGMLFALTNFPDELYTYRTTEPDETAVDQQQSGSTEKDNTNTTTANNNSNNKPGVPNAIKRWQTDSKDYTTKVYLPFPEQSAFPHLIVNIGSGVSILKVSGPGQFERVSGSSLGGGTYWGLCRLLTRCKTYEEVLDLAENGDAGKVDMLVKDIYGGDCESLTDYLD
jgi:type II pantothenate kinase